MTPSQHLEDSTNKLRITTEAFVVCGSDILLFQRDLTSKAFPGFWSVPGGHVDVDEDVKTACMREIQEETGLTVDLNQIKLKYISFHNHLDRKETWHIFGFVVHIPSKHDVINSDEGNARWIPIAEIKNIDLFPPVAYYLEQALDKKSGLLYSASEWEKTQLVRVIKETKDLNL